MSTTRKLWLGLAALLIVSFSVLLWAGTEIFRAAPPMPERVVSTDGGTVYTRADIERGRQVWQSMGGMQLGSIWGHGAYQAPDWSADVIVLGQDTQSDDSQYADRNGGRLISSARVTEGSAAQYGQAQLVVSGRIGEVRIKSSTGIGAQDLTERYDATAPGGPPRLFSQRNETRMIANETRIWQPVGEHFGWVLGTSVIDNRNTLTRALGLAGQPPAASTGVENTVFEITGYGEASYRIAPALTLSAGLRATNVELGGAGEDVVPTAALAGAAITAQMMYDAVTGTASPTIHTTSEV